MKNTSTSAEPEFEIVHAVKPFDRFAEITKKLNEIRVKTWEVQAVIQDSAGKLTDKDLDISKESCDDVLSELNGLLIYLGW
jgi:hypothetical protein